MAQKSTATGPFCLVWQGFGKQNPQIGMGLAIINLKLGIGLAIKIRKSAGVWQAKFENRQGVGKQNSKIGRVLASKIRKATLQQKFDKKICLQTKTAHCVQI